MIELIDVEKSFGDTEVTKGVSLKIPDNEITCIVGRSGEGKSVLLKQIIGLLRPTSGKILVDGEDIAKFNEQQIDANFEKFGYVFQFAALLDSLTVFENVGIKLIETISGTEAVKCALMHFPVTLIAIQLLIANGIDLFRLLVII